MLSLMVGSGIPEISTDTEIAHVRKNLMLNVDDASAEIRLQHIFALCFRYSKTR